MIQCVRERVMLIKEMMFVAEFCAEPHFLTPGENNLSNILHGKAVFQVSLNGTRIISQFFIARGYFVGTRPLVIFYYCKESEDLVADF